MRLRAFAVVLSFASAVFAQNVTIGSLHFQLGVVLSDAGFEVIDTSHPATADGSITNASLVWVSSLGCSNAFKLRVFRLTTDGMNVSLVGETPPLDGIPGNGDVVKVSFPAIAVKKGDLLGVVRLPTSCDGGATFSNSPAAGDTVYRLLSNFTDGPLSSAVAYRGMRLDAVASNAAEHFAGVIPVAGAVQGNGAFFRTSLQLTNGNHAAIDGKIVWHTAGAAGASSDPSITYHLEPNASLSYPDITASLGQSGIGSLDLYASTYTPDVTARIFSDGGSAGTVGPTQDLVTPSEMFNNYVPYAAAIPIAADLTNFRVNVGVRTLDTPTTIGVMLYDAAGKILNVGNAGVLKTYPANYFEQIPLSQFLGNFTSVAPPAGGRMFVYVWSGGSIVFYTSTIDNRTNDSALKMITAK